MPIESRKRLPEYEGKFITTTHLLKMIQKCESNACGNESRPSCLTLLDLRTENMIERDKPIPWIKTTCHTVRCLLDDLRKPEVRENISTDHPVVTITETGNRDIFAMRHLYGFGYRQVYGLRFGMRGWIKMNFPTEIQP